MECVWYNESVNNHTHSGYGWFCEDELSKSTFLGSQLAVTHSLPPVRYLNAVLYVAELVQEYHMQEDNEKMDGIEVVGVFAFCLVFILWLIQMK